jgi:cytochrome c oxidase assembly protein subunit 15
MTSDGEHLSLQALHAIQWVHRVGAIILTGTVIYLFALLRSIPGIGFYGNLLILVITLQFIIGVSNLLLHLPIVLATTHNFLAALLVIILVIINSRLTTKYD